MKAFKLILLFTLIFNVISKAANVDVWVIGDGCSIAQGSCYFGLEPVNTPYTFLPAYTNISGITLSNYDVSYQWTKVSGVVTTPSFLNTERLTVKFTNVANYNSGTASHQLKVKVTWTRKSGISNPNSEPSTYTKESTMRDIEVKYISVPGPLNIAGSTYSNGNQHVHACGTLPITVSVPAVTTDSPSGVAVTYYFTYPSGWSGPSSSSSPSVTVTPSIRSEGVIKVQAKRVDSNYLTEISVNVKRPLPVISSISPSTTQLVCNSTELISANATGSNADYFIWSPLGGALVNGSSSVVNSAGPVYLSATSNGSYEVSAYSSSCEVSSATSKSFKIQFGTQVPQSILPTPKLCWGQQQSMGVSAVENVISYNWTIGYGANLISGQGMQGVIVEPITVAGTLPYSFTASVTTTNICGTSTPYAETFATYNCSGGGVSRISVFPNPASNSINIEFPKGISLQELPESLQLYKEASSKPIKSIYLRNLDITSSSSDYDKVIIDISEIPSGVYFLHLNTSKSEYNTNRSEKIRILKN